MYGRNTSNIFNRTSTNNNTSNNTSSNNIFSRNNTNNNTSNNSSYGNNNSYNNTNSSYGNNNYSNTNTNKLGSARVTNYSSQNPPRCMQDINPKWKSNDLNPMSIVTRPQLMHLTTVQLRIQDYFLIRKNKLGRDEQRVARDAIQKNSFNSELMNSHIISNLKQPITFCQSQPNLDALKQMNKNRVLWGTGSSSNTNNNNNNSSNNIFTSSSNNNNSSSNNIFSRNTNTNANNIFSNSNNSSNNNNNNGSSGNVFLNGNSRSGGNNIFGNSNQNNNTNTNYNNNNNNSSSSNIFNRNSSTNSGGNNIFNNTSSSSNNIFNKNNNNSSNTNTSNIFNNNRNNNNNSSSNNIFSNNNNNNNNNSSGSNIFNSTNRGNNIFNNQSNNNNNGNNGNNIFNSNQNQNRNIFSNNNGQNNNNQNNNNNNNNYSVQFALMKLLQAQQVIMQSQQQQNIQNIQNKKTYNNQNPYQSNIIDQISYQPPLFSNNSYSSGNNFQQKYSKDYGYDQYEDYEETHHRRLNNKKYNPPVFCYKERESPMVYGSDVNSVLKMVQQQRNHKNPNNGNNNTMNIAMNKFTNGKSLHSGEFNQIIYICILRFAQQGQRTVKQRFQQKQLKFQAKISMSEHTQIVSKWYNTKCNQYNKNYHIKRVEIPNFNFGTHQVQCNIILTKVNLPQNYFFIPRQFEGFVINDFEIVNQCGSVRWIGEVDIQGVDFSHGFSIENGKIQCIIPQLDRECIAIFNKLPPQIADIEQSKAHQLLRKYFINSSKGKITLEAFSRNPPQYQIRIKSFPQIQQAN